MHTTDTKDRIIQFIRDNGSATNKELRTLTGITLVGVSKHLGELAKQRKIVKSGQHPRHTYHISQAEINRMAYLRQKESLATVTKSVGEIKFKFLQEVADQIKASKDIPDDQKAKVLESFTKKLSKGGSAAG